MDITKIRECPDCASIDIVHNLRRDQVICKECGLIYEPLAPAMEEKFKRSHGMISSKPKTVKKTVKKKTVKKPLKKKAVKKKAVKKKAAKKVKKKAVKRKKR